MLVKICGITNLDDARAALRAGADWIGLNLVGGPRRIDLALATEILSNLDEPSRCVVLVDCDQQAEPAMLLTTLKDHGVYRLQLYGIVTPVTVERFARDGFESIVVGRVGEVAHLAPIEALLAGCHTTRPSHLLLDGYAAGALGGTGIRANWETIARVREAGRFDAWPPVLLAGGLCPENVADAVMKVGPVGVDVSSGVEAAPGRKDGAKVEAFIAAARSAATGHR